MARSNDTPTPTYWDYLKLSELLTLQGGLEGNEDDLVPDELLFIVVHQALELWFKIVLRELRLARDHLGLPQVDEEIIPMVVHHLRRANRVLELSSDHFKVMETLTPQDFLGFRDKITPASGFQSFQMREIETLLGLPDSSRIRYGKVDPIEHIKEMAAHSPAGKMAWERLSRTRSEGTVRAALHDWLYRTPIHGSVPGGSDDTTVVEGFIDDYLAALDQTITAQQTRLEATLGDQGSEVAEKFSRSREQARQFLWAEDIDETDRPRVRRIRAGLLFIESYRNLPLLAWPRMLVDAVVELEELMVIWRQRHARMVERMIGRRVGTGGSSGVEYLDRTAQVRVFTELWSVRTMLLPKRALPPLQNPEFYGFAR